MDIKIGIVENNVDLMKLGRCQVRIFGLHTEDRELYPTEDLPWAVSLSTSPTISGQSNTFIYNNGDWVAIVFFDQEKQKPIIIGSIPKFVVEQPDFTSGFSDPNSINPSADYVGESGISRLARNENINQTIIQDKKNNRTTGVDCNGTSWDEPETQYAAEYPNNKVIHTKQHVIELDDTNGKERVHIYHKSGTSKEIHPNGDEVDLIKAKRYVVIDSDSNMLVKGNYNVRIETNVNEEIVGNENKKVEGNIVNTIDGDITTTITGNKIENVTGDSTENVSKNKKINSTEATEIVATTSAKLQSGTTLEINGGTTITISATGNITISTSGVISLSGSSISLN